MKSIRFPRLTRETQSAPPKHDRSHIVWVSGVPMHRGHAVAIWDQLPDPLLPPSPRSVSPPHPWNEKRLRHAKNEAQLRYKTLLEAHNVTGRSFIMLEELIRYEMRAAKRAQNLLVVTREWHKKLPLERMEQSMPHYRSLAQQYQEHLDAVKRLSNATKYLRRWISRHKASRIFKPRILDPYRNAFFGNKSKTQFRHSVANMLSCASAHSLALSGIEESQFQPQPKSRTNSDKSGSTVISID